MSKGDSRRPSSVPKEVVDANHEAIFGKKELNVWRDPPTKEGREPSGEVPTDGHESRDLHVSDEDSTMERAE